MRSAAAPLVVVVVPEDDEEPSSSSSSSSSGDLSPERQSSSKSSSSPDDDDADADADDDADAGDTAAPAPLPSVPPVLLPAWLCGVWRRVSLRRRPNSATTDAPKEEEGDEDRNADDIDWDAVPPAERDIDVLYLQTPFVHADVRLSLKSADDDSTNTAAAAAAAAASSSSSSLSSLRVGEMAFAGVTSITAAAPAAAAPAAPAASSFSSSGDDTGTSAAASTAATTVWWHHCVDLPPVVEGDANFSHSSAAALWDTALCGKPAATDDAGSFSPIALDSGFRSAARSGTPPPPSAEGVNEENTDTDGAVRSEESWRVQIVWRRPSKGDTAEGTDPLALAAQRSPAAAPRRRDDLYLETALDGSLQEVWRRESDGNGRFLVLMRRDDGAAGAVTGLLVAVDTRLILIEYHATTLAQHAGDSHTLASFTRGEFVQGEWRVEGVLPRAPAGVVGHPLIVPGACTDWHLIPSSSTVPLSSLRLRFEREDARRVAELHLMQAESLWFGEGCPQNEAAAKELYMKAADAGNPVALARCLYLGLLPRESPREQPGRAFELYRAVAARARGDAVAPLAVEYSEKHERDDGSRGQPPTASDFEAFTPDSDTVTAALFRVGTSCSFGSGTGRNPAAAAQFYRWSAERGHSTGMFNLACSLDGGRGFETADRDEAAEWYSRAASLGHMTATFNLGCHADEAGDYVTASACFERSALQGHSKSQFNMGCYLREGKGVAKDPKGSFRWFLKCAEQEEDFDALTMVGYCYRGGNGVETDLQEAVRWFRRASELGSASATSVLGSMYDSGDGVEQSHEEAARLYQIAAEKGDAGAMFNLGCCYDYGEGVNKDSVAAVKWYRAAAEKNHNSAQFNLGYAYQYGEGVEADIEQARNWYSACADGGDPEGMTALAKLLRAGENVSASRLTESRSWLSKAAAQEHHSAAEMLAEICVSGELGFPADHDAALRLYRTACDPTRLTIDDGDDVENSLEVLRLVDKARELFWADVRDQRRLLQEGVSVSEAVATVLTVRKDPPSGGELQAWLHIPKRLQMSVGDNVLHVAARNGKAESALLFFVQPEFDALLTAKNYDGQTPREVLNTAAHQGVVEHKFLSSLLSCTRLHRALLLVWCWEQAFQGNGEGFKGNMAPFHALGVVPPEIMRIIVINVTCSKGRFLVAGNCLSRYAGLPDFEE